MACSWRYGCVSTAAQIEQEDGVRSAPRHGHDFAESHSEHKLELVVGIERACRHIPAGRSGDLAIEHGDQDRSAHACGEVTTACRQIWASSSGSSFPEASFSASSSDTLGRGGGHGIDSMNASLYGSGGSVSHPGSVEYARLSLRRISWRLQPMHASGKSIALPLILRTLGGVARATERRARRRAGDATRLG